MTTIKNFYESLRIGLSIERDACRWKTTYICDSPYLVKVRPAMRVVIAVVGLIKQKNCFQLRW